MPSTYPALYTDFIFTKCMLPVYGIDSPRLEAECCRVAGSEEVLQMNMGQMAAPVDRLIKTHFVFLILSFVIYLYFYI